MPASQSILTQIQEDFDSEFTKLDSRGDSMIRVPEPGRPWDYQANGSFALAKLLRNSPQSIATQLCERLNQVAQGYHVEHQGKGFLNIRINDSALSQAIWSRWSKERYFTPDKPADIDRVVVDYSHPNVAKEMHVGHLRSTLIGDAISRAFESVSVEVIRHNHIGDWGTPFGMLIEHLLDESSDAIAKISVGHLTEFYRGARQKFEALPEFKERARHRVVLLQGGDPETLHLWQQLVDASRSYFDDLYRFLDVKLTPADYRGESAYNDDLQSVVDELAEKRLLVESEDALVVFPPGFKQRDESPLPLIVRKSDGGFGYAATDLAAIRYRSRVLRADRIFYVVGAPQTLHLAMVFKVAEMAGWLEEGQATHVAFGSVLSPDGKMLRTRSGETIRLRDLLDEALEAAEKRLSDAPNHSTTAARVIAVGAIKFQDLSHQVGSDYRFSIEKMMQFEGKTGPYLQYSVRRARKILAQAEAVEEECSLQIEHPSEHELAIMIDRQDHELRHFFSTLATSLFCEYLHKLAVSFSKFYQDCPVLRADGDIRQSRIQLTAAFEKTLTSGLAIVGIDVPESM